MHPQQDIDRKALRLLKDRLARHFEAGVDALRRPLAPGARVAFDVLPLLLHANHAALPGFIDFDVPAGIDGFEPARDTLNAARKVSLSFTQERFIERRSCIQALAAGPGEGGELSLWVFANDAHHDQLRRKLALITAWTSTQGLSLTTQLIDPLAFRAGESTCVGSTPTLWLDNFYRSGVILAGRYPLWFLIPASEAHQGYGERLRQQRFIGADETFDLGPVATIPRAECLQRGSLALRRALDAPYHWLGEMLLMEAYVMDTDTLPLSTRSRSRLHAGEPSEPTGLAVHRYLEQALDDPDRLNLARRALVASAADTSAVTPIATEWGWTASQISEARHRRGWHLSRVLKEHERFIDEFRRAHSLLQQLLAAAPMPTASSDLNAARIQLDALTDCSEDTVPRINPALIPERLSADLWLGQHKGRWVVKDGDTTLYCAPRLAAVALWAHLHRLDANGFRLKGERHHRAFQRLLDDLHEQWPKTGARTLLLVNVEAEPLAEQHADGLALVSEWDDTLDFSGFHVSLVADADLVRLNADGRVRWQHFPGEQGLIRALTATLDDDLVCCCIGTERQRAIEKRLTELSTALKKAFAKDARIGRYLFTLGERYALIQRGSDGVTGDLLDDETELASRLGTPLADSSPLTVVDGSSRRLAALKTINGLDAAAGGVLLIHHHAGAFKALLRMADGGIHVYPLPSRPVDEQADALFAFLANQRLHGHPMPAIYAAEGGQLARVSTPRVNLPFKVHVRVLSDGHFDVATAQGRWDHTSLDDAICRDIARTVRGQRASAADYPVYLSDLEVTAAATLPEVLALKAQLEARLST